jgi:hypothetical protein
MNYEQAAIAIGNIAEDPGRYLEGRDEQLAKFAPELQTRRFLKILDAS